MEASEIGALPLAEFVVSNPNFNSWYTKDLGAGSFILQEARYMAPVTKIGVQRELMLVVCMHPIQAYVTIAHTSTN